jgi:two-component system chemotaxis response regulator CheV
VARNQVKRVLDQLNLNSTLCKDGQEALEQLQAWAKEGKELPVFLALVISDIEMPRMDGYTLTSNIRKDPALKDLYVILHTSLSGVFNQTMVEKVGANRFLAKYNPDELASIVQNRVAEHRRFLQLAR